MRGQPLQRLAVEADGALLVAQRATDAVDQRALAGAVGADQPQPLARRHVDLDGVERDETAEPLAHAGDLQQHAHGRARRRARTRPMMPFGARTTNSTSSTPTSSRLRAEEIVTVATC